MHRKGSRKSEDGHSPAVSRKGSDKKKGEKKGGKEGGLDRKGSSEKKKKPVHTPGTKAPSEDPKSKKMDLTRALTIMQLRATRQFENAAMDTRQQFIDQLYRV